MSRISDGRDQHVSFRTMRLVVSQEAAALAQERGGRLYVWVKKGRCCGSGARWLTTSSELPERQEFTSVARTESFELFVPVGLSLLPDDPSRGPEFSTSRRGLLGRVRVGDLASR